MCVFNACPKFLPFLLLGVSADFCVLILGCCLCRTALSTHSKLITCVLLSSSLLYSRHNPDIVAEQLVFLGLYEIRIGISPKERKEIDTGETAFNNLTFNRVRVCVSAIWKPTKQRQNGFSLRTGRLRQFQSTIIYIIYINF